METLNSIFVAFLSLSIEAQLAVILGFFLILFAADALINHIRSTNNKKPYAGPSSLALVATDELIRTVRPHKNHRHTRGRYQNNSEKEDFFDMITRFREEIPA
ncbi:membrane protein [Gordonia phage AlainaMarie]|nr:membrane protein [Gordonia phage AlainaMarie]